MSKSEPPRFSCPGCGAKYHVVTVDAPADTQEGKVACLKCGALFPDSDMRSSVRYFLVGRPRPPYIWHNRGRKTDE